PRRVLSPDPHHRLPARHRLPPDAGGRGGAGRRRLHADRIMSDFGAALRAAKASGDLGALAAAIPYAGFLGIRFGLADGALLATLPYQPKLIGNPLLPALHGGVIGAFLEHTAITHLMWDSDAEEVPKTIDV